MFLSVSDEELYSGSALRAFGQWIIGCVLLGVHHVAPHLLPTGETAVMAARGHVFVNYFTSADGTHCDHLSEIDTSLFSLFFKLIFFVIQDLVV